MPATNHRLLTLEDLHLYKYDEQQLPMILFELDTIAMMRLRSMAANFLYLTNNSKISIRISS